MFIQRAEGKNHYSEMLNIIKDLDNNIKINIKYEISATYLLRLLVTTSGMCVCGTGKAPGYQGFLWAHLDS